MGKMKDLQIEKLNRVEVLVDNIKTFGKYIDGMSFRCHRANRVIAEYNLEELVDICIDEIIF